MAYNLKIEKLNHPLLKPLLKDVLPVFEKLGIKFFVIGATARDIVLEVFKMETSRRTQDIDIAIAIEDWERFSEVKEEILKLSPFEPDSHQLQKLIYKGSFEVDLVPYGKIARDKNKIFWPPDHDIAMSVLGFEEIEQDLIEVDFGE